MEDELEEVPINNGIEGLLSTGETGGEPSLCKNVRNEYRKGLKYSQFAAGNQTR